jgi:uncharacterized cupin superfamily protein
MAMLTPLTHLNLPDVPAKECAPEILIAGAPTFRSWVMEESLEGRFRSGVWEMTPGEYTQISKGKAEFCYILEGQATITPDDGEPFNIGPGSAFTLKPDFKGAWKTTETIRKYWVLSY